MNCAVCGRTSPAAKPKLQKDGIDIWQCSYCGLAFWQPPEGFRPEAAYDGSYFDDPEASHGYDDYGSLESSLRATFRRRIARLPPPHPGARLLDVGAAYGFSVAEGSRAGWRACGIEVSAAAARRARDVSGGRVALASVRACPFASECFDAVTMWDVIEHLPDPHAGVRAVADLLRPGGRLVLTTGDAGSLLARISGGRWHLYTLPEHLFFFTRRSLRVLLEEHGLRVVSIRAESAIFTLGYLFERLRKTLLGRPGRSGRSEEQPVGWPGARLRIPVNLFDVVTVTAVREDRK